MEEDHTTLEKTALIVEETGFSVENNYRLYISIKLCWKMY